MKTTFDALDLDGSGELDEKELKAAMSLFGQDMNAEKIQELIRHIDKDGDNKVQFTEFARMMSKHFNRLSHDAEGACSLAKAMAACEEARKKYYVTRSKLEDTKAAFHEQLEDPFAIQDETRMAFKTKIEELQKELERQQEEVIREEKILDERKNSESISTRQLEESFQRVYRYEQRIQDLKDVFKRFANGEDELDDKALSQAMTSMGTPTPSERELTLLMQELDKDESGTVDFSEFVTAVVQKLRFVDAEKSLKVAFKQFDRDESDSLDPAEYVARTPAPCHYANITVAPSRRRRLDPIVRILCRQAAITPGAHTSRL